MIDNKTKNKIISTLRKLCFAYKPRTTAKSLCKVGPALYRCSNCGILVYEGKSEKNYLELLEEWGEPILMEAFNMDHIDPVICPKSGWQGWDSYIERLFIDIEGWQGICQICHSEKCLSETNTRKITRKRKKLNDKKEK